MLVPTYAPLTTAARHACMTVCAAHGPPSPSRRPSLTEKKLLPAAQTGCTPPPWSAPTPPCTPCGGASGRPMCTGGGSAFLQGKPPRWATGAHQCCCPACHRRLESPCNTLSTPVHPPLHLLHLLLLVQLIWPCSMPSGLPFANLPRALADGSPQLSEVAAVTGAPPPPLHSAIFHPGGPRGCPCL